MLDAYIITTILLLLTDVIAIYLAGWVYFSNPKRKLNKTFILMLVFMLFWVNSAYFARFMYLSRIDNQSFLPLFFLRIAWFATPLFFVSFYFLILQLFGKINSYQFLNKAVLFLGISMALVAGLTDLVVKENELAGIFLKIIYGSGIIIFLTIISFLTLATFYPLLKEYFKASSEIKKKIKYLLAEFFIFYLANLVFNIIFPIFFDIPYLYFLGDYSTVILLIFIGYIIVRNGIAGAKIILMSTVVISFTVILLLLNIFIFTSSLVLKMFELISLLAFLFLGRRFIKSFWEEEKLNRLEKTADNLKINNKKLRESS